MTLTYSTLQARFSRTKAWRRAICEYCKSNGLPHDNPVIYEAMGDLISTRSDNQIRDMCRLFLQAEAITEAEKRELLHLLRNT